MSFSIIRNHTEKPGLCPSACLRLLGFDHQLKHPQGLSWTPPSASEQGLVQREVEAKILPGPSIKRWRRARHPMQLGNGSAARGSCCRDWEEDLRFAVCCCGRGQPPPTCPWPKTAAAPAATAALLTHVGDLALALLVTKAA